MGVERRRVIVVVTVALETTAELCSATVVHAQKKKY